MPFLGFWILLDTGYDSVDKRSARRKSLYRHSITQRNTWDKHLCLQRDSNPRPQQPSGYDLRLRQRGHRDRQVIVVSCEALAYLQALGEIQPNNLHKLEIVSIAFRIEFINNTCSCSIRRQIKDLIVSFIHSLHPLTEFIHLVPPIATALRGSWKMVECWKCILTSDERTRLKYITVASLNGGESAIILIKSQ
jgi:hypothetical protein